MMRFVIACLFLILFYTGCTSVRYHYVPPKNEKDRNCIMECEKVKSTCDVKNQEIYKQCLFYREQEEREYRRCTDVKGQCVKPENLCKEDGSYQYGLCMEKYREDLKRFNVCNNRQCHYPRYCSNSDQMGCVQNYNRCFQICGGEIIVIEE